MDCFRIPFWIPVVLLSAQYGSSGGVIAAITGVLLYLLLGLPQQGVDQDYYDYLIDLWKQPALWTLTAIILGEIGTRHINERIYLSEQMMMFKKQRQTIADYCTQLEQNIGGLERQLATIEEHSSKNLIGQFKAIAALDAARLEADFPSLMEQIFGPIDFALHRFSNAGSGRLLAQGEGVDDHFKKPLEHIVSGELREWLEQSARPFSVLTKNREKSFDDQCLFAEPLRNDNRGGVIGALIIHQLPPEAINEDTQVLLQIIASVLEENLSREQRYPREQALNIRESA